MKKYKLGEFEEIVMLTVGVLHGEAYGVSIKKEIEERADRKVSVGALQVALKRLEEKGFLRSYSGEETQERAGRPKLYYQITANGQRALEYSRDLRNELWAAMKIFPDLKFLNGSRYLAFGTRITPSARYRIPRPEKINNV